MEQLKLIELSRGALLLVKLLNDNTLLDESA